MAFDDTLPQRTASAANLDPVEQIILSRKDGWTPGRDTQGRRFIESIAVSDDGTLALVRFNLDRLPLEGVDLGPDVVLKDQTPPGESGPSVDEIRLGVAQSAVTQLRPDAT